jgi:hypothetical protein
MKVDPITPKPSDYNAAHFIDRHDDDPNTIYFCNYRNTRLHYQSTDQETGKRIFLCLKCNIEYIPANQLVKHSSHFETPQGPHKELLTATIDADPKAPSTQYVDKQQNLSPLFKALEQRGFRFTHYEEPKAHPTKYNDKRIKDLPDVYKALAGKGFKWTSYHEH